MVDESNKEYTLEEISQHNKTDDCWLIIGNMNNGMFVGSVISLAGVGGFRRPCVCSYLCVFIRSLALS
jgi:hypothetical protein